MIAATHRNAPSYALGDNMRVINLPNTTNGVFTINGSYGRSLVVNREANSGPITINFRVLGESIGWLAGQADGSLTWHNDITKKDTTLAP